MVYDRGMERQVWSRKYFYRFIVPEKLHLKFEPLLLLLRSCTLSPTARLGFEIWKIPGLNPPHSWGLSIYGEEEWLEIWITRMHYQRLWSLSNFYRSFVWTFVNGAHFQGLCQISTCFWPNFEFQFAHFWMLYLKMPTLTKIYPLLMYHFSSSSN